MSGTVQESFDRAWREGIQSKTQQKDQESDEDSEGENSIEYIYREFSTMDECFD